MAYPTDLILVGKRSSERRIKKCLATGNEGSMQFQVTLDAFDPINQGEQLSLSSASSSKQ